MFNFNYDLHNYRLFIDQEVHILLNYQFILIGFNPNTLVNNQNEISSFSPYCKKERKEDIAEAYHTSLYKTEVNM